MLARYSITEARCHLSRLIRVAEGGGVVELTRRGSPVAVLIGRRHYDRLTTTRRSFSHAYDDFAASANLAELAPDPDEMFVAIRYETPGRPRR